MALPSVTYTFSNGNASDAGQVNTNFQDIIDALTDGTSDLTIGSLTVIGTTTISGNTSLGTLATITLNNGATHGGRIQFDGGITSYIGSSSDGTTLTIAGFTTFSVPQLTSSGAISGAALTATGAINFSGTSGHSVSEEFANEVIEEYARPTGTSVGLRGVAISTESSAVSETTTTPQDIGVTATIITTGRPVFVGLMADNSQGELDADASVFPADTTATASGIVKLLRDGVVVSTYKFTNAIQTLSAGILNAYIEIPVSSVWYIDTPAAGTYVYTCTIEVGSTAATTDTISVDDVKIVAFEL